MQRRAARRGDGAVSPLRSFLSTKQITACHRCHEKKVKCSGGHPCRNCLQAGGSSCSYPQRNRTVKVPQRLIDGLLQEIDDLKGQLESGQNDPPDPAGSRDRSPLRSQPPEPPERPEPISDSTDQENEGINLISSVKPWFDNRNVFHTPILIGEAADTAFATRFRQVISDRQNPEPHHLLRVNYATNEMLTTLAELPCAWPSQVRAKFLVHASLKYVNRHCFAFSARSIMEEMTKIFFDPTGSSPAQHCKFWALFALGELCTSRISTTHSYPGMEYFAQASKLLCLFEERPDMDFIETLLLLSLYSLALNRRYSAYILVGTAMRSAIVSGFNFNVPVSQLPDPNVQEHRKRVFWSVYIFDRMWGANLSHPPAIQSKDIEIDLPAKPISNQHSINSQTPGDTPDFEYQIAHIKLAGHFDSVIQSIYNRSNQDKEISTRVHDALRALEGWMDELPTKLQIDKSSAGPNDPTILSLHLSFHQCVILATRPILLHMLRVQINASRAETAATSAPEIPAEASALSEACIQCARSSAQLLTQAWIDGSFLTFDCFFTKYLFSALTVLAVSSILDGRHRQADRASFEEVSRLLKELKEGGNYLAQEYSHHLDAIDLALTTHTTSTLAHDSLNIIEPYSMVPDTITSQYPRNTPPQGLSTDGNVWSGQSLQMLLSQPVLNSQFLEDAVRDTYSQNLYQFDMNSSY